MAVTHKFTIRAGAKVALPNIPGRLRRWWMRLLSSTKRPRHRKRRSTDVWMLQATGRPQGRGDLRDFLVSSGPPSLERSS